MATKNKGAIKKLIDAVECGAREGGMEGGLYDVDLAAVLAARDEIAAKDKEIEELRYEHAMAHNGWQDETEKRLSCQAEIGRLEAIEKVTKDVYAVLTMELAEPKGTETAAMVSCCSAIEAALAPPAEKEAK